MHNPTSNPHTILSIGPIYDALMTADNTRAAWTVSFMFSYLMRETIRHLRTELNDDTKFLVPNMSDTFKSYLKDGQRIGIFHDRLILKGDYKDEVKNAFEQARDALISKIIETFNASIMRKYVKLTINEAEEKKITAYFEGFFQYYIASVDVPSGRNPILELSTYMDAMEHFPALPPHEEEEYLFLFLRLTNLGVLQEVGFGDEAYEILKERCFKSLPEISAWELIRRKYKEYKEKYLCLTIDDAAKLKDPASEAEEILRRVKSDFPDAFRPYHKYVAVVHGDGDGFGKYLESIGDNEGKIRRFSDNVAQFVTDARDAIRDYGGYPVIGAGEDLLFYAPIINGARNIFTLINEIDCLFAATFRNPELSMSYGISVSYYKYPLQEAMELSRNALWEIAKESRWISSWQQSVLANETNPNVTEDMHKNLPAKNAIALQIRKHSGQSHTLVLRKNTRLYCRFIKLVEQELNPDDKLHLPHALHHSLDRIAPLIDAVEPERVAAVFENFFNENIHKTRHARALEASVKMLQELLSTESAQPIHRYGHESSASATFFAMLSVIKLLRGDE